MSWLLLQLIDLMLLVPTCIQIFLYPTHLYGSMSSMRNVGTLSLCESSVLLASETYLVLLSSSIIHVFGLRTGGGVLVRLLPDSIFWVSSGGIEFKLLWLKESILLFNWPQIDSRMSKRSITLDYESWLDEAFSNFFITNSSIASNLVTL